MKKKISLSAMAGLLSVGMLAACGNDDGNLDTENNGFDNNLDTEENVEIDVENEESNNLDVNEDEFNEPEDNDYDNEDMETDLDEEDDSVVE